MDRRILYALGLAVLGVLIMKPAWTVPVVGLRYLPQIKAAADVYGVPFLMLARLLWQESRFNPKAVNSRSGASGIAQFMPATAQELGIDPFNPDEAIPAAALYLTRIKSYLGVKSWGPVLAGYNWGMGNVKKAMAAHGDKWLTVAPKETQDYVAQIGGDAGVV